MRAGVRRALQGQEPEETVLRLGQSERVFLMGYNYQFSEQEDRERQAKADMLKAFEPLPESIRAEIKLRVALVGGLASPHTTFEGAFMERCAVVARLFVLDLK